MSTIATPAIYREDGIVIPKMKPAVPPQQVVVVYINGEEKREDARQNLFETLKAVHERNARFSPEEVEADVDAAIQDIRHGPYAG